MRKFFYVLDASSRLLASGRWVCHIEKVGLRRWAAVFSLVGGGDMLTLVSGGDMLSLVSGSAHIRRPPSPGVLRATEVDVCPAKVRRGACRSLETGAIIAMQIGFRNIERGGIRE